MWGITLFDQLLCRIGLKQLRYDGRYTPPSLQGSLIYPGDLGVFGRGGVAVDPLRQVMVGMPTYLASTSRLVVPDEAEAGPSCRALASPARDRPGATPPPPTWLTAGWSGSTALQPFAA